MKNQKTVNDAGQSSDTVNNGASSVGNNGGKAIKIENKSNDNSSDKKKKGLKQKCCK